MFEHTVDALLGWYGSLDLFWFLMLPALVLCVIAILGMLVAASLGVTPVGMIGDKIVWKIEERKKDEHQEES